MQTRKTAELPLPDIVVGDADHKRLMALANGVSGPMADTAEQLLTELERARVVPQNALPANAVCMGADVRFETTDGFNRTLQLVYPDAADISQRRISVLTPIGAALIGLVEGQSIPWSGRDGREHVLTVLSVSHAETVEA